MWIGESEFGFRVDIVGGEEKGLDCRQDFGDGSKCRIDVARKLDASALLLRGLYELKRFDATRLNW